MKVTTLSSITEIGPEVWNSIVGRNRLICRHEYLLAVESSRINDCRFFYPIVYDNDGRMVAHACLYYISTELDSFAQGFTKKVIAGIRRYWKSFLILRSVECGTPVALGSTLSFVDGTDKAAALDAIVRESERVARELKVRVILFRDFYSGELHFFDRLLGSRYRPVANLSGAGFVVRWPTFQAYLDSLRSQYRRIIRKRLNAFHADGYTIREVSDYAHLALDLERLWKNTYDHATEYRRERLETVFFIEVKRCLGDRAGILLVEKDGLPVAFSLLLEDDDTLITLFCGLDYSCSRDSYIYFNLFYKSIQVAISRRKKEIDFGITTLVPKVEVGGEVTPLTMYMKCTIPGIGLAVPAMFAIMTPQQRIPARQIFKATEGGQSE